MAVRKVFGLVMIALMLCAGCCTDNCGSDVDTSALTTAPTSGPVGTATLRSTCSWGQAIMGCDDGR
jgi:hypothetical protein